MKDLKRVPCEVWSRVCGYLRPVSQWNAGKQNEFKDRKDYKITKKDYTLDEKSTPKRK